MTTRQVQALAQRIEREEPAYKVWTISRYGVIVHDTKTGAFFHVTQEEWNGRRP